MKNKKKVNPKEESKKFLKIISVGMFFYLGLRLVLLPLLFSSGQLAEIGVFNLILNLGIIIFGLVAAFFLLTKFKRWALNSLIGLLLLQIVSGVALTASLGNVKPPLVQIAILILLISGHKQLDVIGKK